MKHTSNWSLIGIPDQQGVINVGGRAGTVYGPKAFRQVFSKLQGHDPVHSSLLVNDDLQGITSNILVNHRLAIEAIAKKHGQTGISVVVGGGHDHGYTHLAGVLQSIRGKQSSATLGCINLDAHLDVRKPEPEITSGSPFYLAIENGTLSPDHLIEFGVQTHCNRPALWEYVKDKKIHVFKMNQLRGGRAVAAFESELKGLCKKSDAVVISLDLDSIAEAHAPGVSAPQSEGFTPSEIIEICEIAGREPKVISLGIFELNPEHDSDQKTARLAATAAYHFISNKITK